MLTYSQLVQWPQTGRREERRAITPQKSASIRDTFGRSVIWTEPTRNPTAKASNVKNRAVYALLQVVPTSEAVIMMSIESAKA